MGSPERCREHRAGRRKKQGPRKRPLFVASRPASARRARRVGDATFSARMRLAGGMRVPRRGACGASARLAGMAGIELVVIDAATRLRPFKEGLRNADLYYHLAQGIRG